MSDFTERVAEILYRQSDSFHESSNGYRRGWARRASDILVEALRKDGYVIFDPKQITRVEVIGDKVYTLWADECAALVDDGRLAIFPYGEGLEAQGIYADKKLAEIKARQDQIVKAVAMCMSPDIVG